MAFIPQATWDEIASSLHENNGVATIRLPAEATKVSHQAFHTAGRALDVAHTDTHKNLIPWIAEGVDSSHATGYHRHGNSGGPALSRYNAHREGFVFSNGESFPILLNDDGDEGNSDSFEEDMNSIHHLLLHDIASNVLKAISRRLEIDALDGEEWFESTYGPMAPSSQWHMKRYVDPPHPSSTESTATNDKHESANTETPISLGTEEKDVEWLPVHTDPSLISIIIHDAPGVNPHAMGLQYSASLPLDEDGRRPSVWKEVAEHGHGVATIFCGSLLSYITGGYFPSAKHRVIYKPINEEAGTSRNHRQAVTLFVRPRDNSILTVPPCDALRESQGGRQVKIRREVTFRDWLGRVSRNYMKGNGKKKKTGPRNSKSRKERVKQQKDASDPLYWADEFTELTLHTTSDSNVPLSGKEKYLGGELCEVNGHIYTIPGFSDRVLAINVNVEPPQMTLIGPELPGEYKWLRGIPIGNIIYGIPCHSDSILKIDASTNDVSLLRWNEALPGAAPFDQKWKWHGAAVSPHDGCIYCIPQAAEHVMKLDPTTEQISFIGPAFPGVNKWYGGLLGKVDGAIYGICQNASGILRIDPKTQQCTIHGDFPTGGYKWHGGVNHPNGTIYCIPAHEDTILKVEPGINPKLSLIGQGKVRTGEHRSDGKYKFLGGTVSGDYVYFFPSDADYVCEVNTKTDEVREIGPNLRTCEKMRNNKWQNGFTAKDGTIYGIPLKGETVLRVRPNHDKGEPDVATIGGPYLGLNKWEGGVYAPNGDMYCVPLNHKYSLRIRPRSKDTDLKRRYTYGNATLRSSGHTLRYSKSRTQDTGPLVGIKQLPSSIRKKLLIPYNRKIYTIREEVARMLRSLNPSLIGNFETQNDRAEHNLRLEDFVVPALSLLPSKKSKARNGVGEKAQLTLSDFVANDQEFLDKFDLFLMEVILPWLKEKLISDGLFMEDSQISFYYQRPPTLRIQPGPSTRGVQAHSDATYGHQDGELNFWMPLTDPNLTLTDLWAESEPGKEDYQALGPKLGEVVSFHGSSCKHYVPPNLSSNTRVSIDFRVGIEGYFDPHWKMRGTKSDHTRRTVRL